MWICGGDCSENGQWPLSTFLSRRQLSSSSHLYARHFNFTLYATGVFQADNSGARAHRELSLTKSVCGFFKKNCLGLQKFLLPTQSPLVCAARSYGDLSSCHWNPGLGGLVWGGDSSLPRYSSRIFSHDMWVGPTCSTSVPLLPLWMDVVSLIL